MALVLVNNACLDSAIAAKDAAQFGFGASGIQLVHDPPYQSQRVVSFVLT